MASTFTLSATINTVNAYKTIATDPEKRLHLVKDQACIQFLAYVLDDTNLEVMMPALETLHLLIQETSCCKYINKVYGVVEGLNAIILNSREREEVKTLAKDIYNRLTIASKLEKSSGDKKKTVFNYPTSTSQQQLFIGAANRRAKTLVFRITGLVSTDHRTMVENQLVNIKGVVSITFDMIRQRCIVRANSDMDPSVVANAISDLESMAVQQVVVDSEGVERLINFIDKRSTVKDSVAELPSYLAEDDLGPIGETAVTTLDFLREKTSTWIGSAAGFLARSFYW